MITNTGKSIIAKYLVGQAPAYASYIAIGCGPKPLALLSCDIKKTSVTSNIATITTDQPHGFDIRQKILVSNSLKSNIDDVYLGSYTILSVPSTTTFTYALTSADLTEETLSPMGTVSVDFLQQTSLDFEMFRVPITSRGFVNEDGVNKIVLTAELPTEERYEISEVGLYSAGSNPSVGAYDSKTVYIFNDSEGWEYHPQDSTPTTISSIFVPIGGESGLISGEYPINTTTRAYDSNGTLTKLPVFKTSADNRTFTDEVRINRYERSRFLNSVILIQGDNAGLSTEFEGGIKRLKVQPQSNHIHLTGANLDFSKNAPSDEFKLAFSVISKSELVSAPAPDRVRVLVEFASSDIHGSGQWARFEVDVDDVSFTPTNVADAAPLSHNFTTSRYITIAKQLQDLRKSSGFTWGEVDVAKVYVSVIKGTALVSNKAATTTTVTLTTSTDHGFLAGDKILVSGLESSGRFDGMFTINEVTSNTIKYFKTGTAVSSTAVSPTVRIESPSEDYYVALDAFRLDNKSQANPLYGLTGYSVIKNAGGKTIIKDANTTNYVEFRFGMDVV